MAIDIRATVTCSLGTLISASINDEYVQDTGLIKCTGTCELSGVYTPAIGTAVTFSYTQGGVTRQVPRKLRVLSSFADPFRRTTSVSLGCKLKYLENLQEPVNWDAFDDPDNAGLTEQDARIVTLPIRAKSVMNKCLTELGITASSNPLTNSFSVAAFDFSGGYVSVLSDLLVSESYCGYLDTSEVLQVFSLDQKGGTGPVVDSTKIIDLGPINVGELPGESVTVSYSTLKLKEPDPNADEDALAWEKDETVGPLQTYYVKYGDNSTATYTGRQTTLTESQYQTFQLGYFNTNGSSYYKLWSWQNLGERDVKVKETVTTTSPKIAGEEKYAGELLANGISYASTEITSGVVETTWTYSRLTGDQIGSETIEYEAKSWAYGRIGVPLVFSSTDYVNLSTNLIPIRKTVTKTEKIGTFTRSTTTEYAWGPLTQQGSQGLAQAAQYFTTAAAVESYLTSVTSAGLVHVGTTVSSTEQGLANYQGRPSAAGRTNAQYADGGDPNNGWRTESQSELELALGSATAQRRVELSMPKAPDDVFSGPSGGPFTALPSDADEKAKRYGRSQNRLRLGNRSGMNIQMPAPVIPSAPFAPFIVQANGLSALYRTNGTSWQMDANGILASTDALFWGAVGGTGSFWFPVAPGITTLPTTPAVVDGQMTVGTTVPVWNETLAAVGRTSTKLAVASLSYPLTLLTEVAVATKTKLNVRNVIRVDVPSASIAVAAVAPSQVGAPAPTDPSFANVSLLMHMNGTNNSTTFIDSSSNAHAVTVYGNCVIDAFESKFGGASGYFDGSGDYLTVPYSSVFNLSSGDWTLEAWFNAFSLGTGRFIVCKGDNASNLFDWCIRVQSTSIMLFTNGITDSLTATVPSIATYQWHHVAIVRSSGTNTIYLNGVAYASNTMAITNLGTSPISIGARNVGGNLQFFNGNIDEVRITKGVARYTSNFTPPTAAFPDQ